MSITCAYYEGQPLPVLPCSPGSFETSGGAPGGECSDTCPPELPLSNEGASSADDCLPHPPPPETCTEIRLVNMCLDTLDETEVQGKYKLLSEENLAELVVLDCPAVDIGGQPVYANAMTYLTYSREFNGWLVNAGVCGTDHGYRLFGGAGQYPFEETAETWLCGNAFAPVPTAATIECTYYDGEMRPCFPGSFEPTGRAPNGICNGTCPSNFPASSYGSMSITDCQPMGVNFLVVSFAGDRLMEFNGDSEDFLTAIDGGELDAQIGRAHV